MEEEALAAAERVEVGSFVYERSRPHDLQMELIENEGQGASGGW